MEQFCVKRNCMIIAHAESISIMGIMLERMMQRDLRPEGALSYASLPKEHLSRGN